MPFNLPDLDEVESFDWSPSNNGLYTHLTVASFDGPTAIGPGTPAIYMTHNGGFPRFNTIGTRVTPNAKKGLCVMIDNIGGFYNTDIFMTFQEDFGGPIHVKVQQNSGGHLVVSNGSGTVLGTTTFAVPLSGAFHLEGIVQVHSSTGTVDIYYNGLSTPIFTISGANTKNGGTGVIGYIEHAAQRSGQMVWHQANNGGRVGFRRWRYIPDTVAGTYTTGVTLVGGATIQATVNETATNEDTSYTAQDNTSLPKQFTAGLVMPSIRNLLYVVPQTVTRSDDVGLNTGRVLIRANGTDDDGGVDVSPLATYKPLRRYLRQDPSSVADWTTTPTIEVGWKRTG